MTNYTIPCPRVPAAPFVEWLEQRIQLHKRRIDQYYRWLATCPPEHGHVQAVCMEIGWFPSTTGRTDRMWDKPTRRLYRFRKGLSDTKRHGKKFTMPVDTFRRKVVEEALYYAGVDFRHLYEDHAERFAGRSGRPADVLRFIQIWEPLLDLWAADDAPLETDQWCNRCGELTTPIQGRCPWHSHAYELRAA